MIIGEGIDMPYVGFALPLFLLTFPMGLGFVLIRGRRFIRKGINIQILISSMPPSVFLQYGFRLYLPLILLLAFMVLPKISPRHIYDPGLPFDFMLSALAGLFCDRRMNLWKAAREAMKEAIPVMGILVGVGMFIQIMTLTGARGWFVVDPWACRKDTF